MSFVIVGGNSFQIFVQIFWYVETVPASTCKIHTMRSFIKSKCADVCGSTTIYRMEACEDVLERGEEDLQLELQSGGGQSR